MSNLIPGVIVCNKILKDLQKNIANTPVKYDFTVGSLNIPTNTPGVNELNSISKILELLRKLPNVEISLAVYSELKDANEA